MFSMKNKMNSTGSDSFCYRQTHVRGKRITPNSAVRIITNPRRQVDVFFYLHGRRYSIPHKRSRQKYLHHRYFVFISAVCLARSFSLV